MESNEPKDPAKRRAVLWMVGSVVVLGTIGGFLGAQLGWVGWGAGGGIGIGAVVGFLMGMSPEQKD
ncbi:hypothetical protein FB468_2404 [Leucobacter komagatae]|uniref:Uncharacterized protein n=1 Tax=Leucobacter komagatae TaxID=55969 RepID=A0A542Y8I6_9MICO|nr:hypothetical protein [Leucobacter komagatae]TQL44347.1 hypothetical protein FB468_2404 [Leucobacter komagatae]